MRHYSSSADAAVFAVDSVERRSEINNFSHCPPSSNGNQSKKRILQTSHNEESVGEEKKRLCNNIRRSGGGSENKGTNLLSYGKYRLLELIGFTKLFRGLFKPTNTFISLLYVDDIDKASLRNEIKIQSLLGWNNYCMNIVDVIKIDGGYFVVKEACVMDLHTHLKQHKRFHEKTAMEYFRQIAALVQICHNKKVVLRDLKLNNLVVTDKRKLKVKFVNFQGSVLIGSEDEDDSITDLRCSPAYASPEILKGKGQSFSGKAADMWSLGVILYTLLVGTFPFVDTNPSELFKKIMKGNFNMPRFLSPCAQTLIKSLLRTNPVARPNISEILNHPWMNQEDALVHQHNVYSKSDFDVEDRVGPLFDEFDCTVAEIKKKLDGEDVQDSLQLTALSMNDMNKKSLPAAVDDIGGLDHVVP